VYTSECAGEKSNSPCENDVAPRL